MWPSCIHMAGALIVSIYLNYNGIDLRSFSIDESTLERSMPHFQNGGGNRDVVYYPFHRSRESGP